MHRLQVTPARAPADPESLPQSPGVYVLLGHAGSVRYVAGSEDLRQQIVSDLAGRGHLPHSDQDDSGSVTGLGYIVTGSTVEAELLELDLVRRWNPDWNSPAPGLRSHFYLHVDTTHPFPLVTVQPHHPPVGVEGFGPFPDPAQLHLALSVARPVLGLRQCADASFPPESRESCPRLASRLCSGPCRGDLSPAVYRGRLQRLLTFLRGEDERLVDDLRRAYQARKPEPGSEFDRGACALLELRKSIASLSAPLRDARLLVSTPGATGRITLILFRRGRVVSRLRVHPRRMALDDIIRRLRADWVRHQHDPVGLLHPHQVQLSRVVRYHIGFPAPGELVFPITHPADLTDRLRRLFS